jgi:hypothetical protein
MHITHTTGRNTNGHKTATLRNERTGELIARGIQTLQNAPTVHNDRGDKSDACTRYKVAELATYIYKHGNATQRQRLDRAGYRVNLLAATRGEYILDDQDAEQIAQLLGGRHATRARIEQVLKYSASMLPAHGIFERVHYCEHENAWSYCAGQDYTAEIPTIRDILKK